jgi:hypothetical protein
MKPRHAAALAVVGWCLMVPPFTRHGVNIKAPMFEWEQVASFETASECAEYAAGMEKYAAGRAKQSKDPRYRDMLRYAAQAFSDARCVATDDPRLKKK